MTSVTQVGQVPVVTSVAKGGQRSDAMSAVQGLAEYSVRVGTV